MTADPLDAARDLCAFIDASPSPFHAVAAAAARLDAAGFRPLAEPDPWDDAGSARYVVRDGSLIAWRRPPEAPPAAPWRLVGAHTDSPNLRIKPRPDLPSGSGARQLGVEVYGGPLLNSWLDRDLGLSGRVALRDGTMRLLLVAEPVLRIPQLAIHLDREVNTAGLRLNPQDHLNPLWGLGGAAPGDFARFLAERLGVGDDEVVAWDVMVHDVQPSTLTGPGLDMLSAPRLDNLCSAWAAVEAITASPPAAGPAMVVLFDHEEVGSASHRGAESPMVETVLERVTTALGGTRDDLHQALAGSLAASADMAHATHPSYPDRHDPRHVVALGGGPVVKTNASQRYATDARTAAAFAHACAAARVPVQHFVSRNDLPCGSTIGPLTAARLGIATVDVGAPQLAMHSARELMASADPAMYASALTAWLAGS